MATNLEFTKTDGVWTAEVVSPGSAIAVEVNRTECGPLLVKGSVEGLKEIPLHYFGPKTDRDLLFEVDVPEGVRIHLISYTEVTGAKYQGNG